jgi:hypothetical protein
LPQYQSRTFSRRAATTQQFHLSRVDDPLDGVVTLDVLGNPVQRVTIAVHREDRAHHLHRLLRLFVRTNTAARSNVPSPATAARGAF